MKICILSMQNIQNFGSLLQSYSLMKLLTEQGHSVSFLPIEPISTDNELLNGYLEDFSSESQKSTNLLNKLKKIDKYTLNRLIIKQKSIKQDKLFDQFRKDYLKIKGNERADHFDYCIIGSDEVFNCNISSPWGFTSQLFGNVKQADKIITYAACCGSTMIENVPNEVKNKIKESFNNISAFSVRDENTFSFVKELTSSNINIHLDPVVIGNFDKEINNAQLPINLPKKYCIIYSYYNRINDKKEIKRIKQFCRNNNLEIISIGAPQMWIKNHIICDPFQMLKVFKNASFVITDTFHGSIFASKYSKRFAIILRKSNANKLSDLIKRLNINMHQINSINDLQIAYSIENNNSLISEIQLNERNKTIEYLKNNLT